MLALLDSKAAPETRDATVARVIDRIGNLRQLENAPGGQEFFILLKPEFQVINTVRSKSTLEQKVDPADINTKLSGLIYQVPAQVTPEVLNASRPPALQKQDQGVNDSFWLLLCPDCPPADPDKPAVTPKGIVYSIAAPCSKTTAASIEEINRSLNRLGLRVINKPGARAVQLFIYKK